MNLGQGIRENHERSTLIHKILMLLNDNLAMQSRNISF